MTIITKHGEPTDLELKAVGDDGTFTGYASVFNVKDFGGDIVASGAFTKSLAARPANRVKMLRGHSTDDPIGIWTSLVEDDRGLLATGKLILDTRKGAETYALLKAGALDGLSIGFRTLRDRVDRTKGARVLEEVDLLEISIVTFPMNPAATVGRVKTASPGSFRDLVEAINGARRAISTN
jgi:HK97 family phage prohead protease